MIFLKKYKSIQEKMKNLKKSCADPNETEAEHLRYILEILDVIDRINELILYEKKEHIFLNKCCQLLVEQKTFENVMIVLFNGSIMTESYFNSCTENEFIEDFYLTKPIPYCMQQSYIKTGIHIMNDQNHYCLDCPQNKIHKGKSILTTILTHKNNMYGFICVPAKNRRSCKENEVQKLFINIANSIAMSLWLIKANNQFYISEKVAEDLNLSEKDGVVFFNFDGQISLFNKRMEQIFNCTAVNLKGNNMVKFIQNDLLEEWIYTVSLVIEMGFPQNIKTKGIIIDGVDEIPIEMVINRLYLDKNNDIGLYAIIKEIDSNIQIKT